MPDRYRSRDMCSLECDPGATYASDRGHTPDSVPAYENSKFSKGATMVWVSGATPSSPARCRSMRSRRATPWPAMAAESLSRRVPRWGSHLATSQPRTCARPVGMAIMVADGRGRTGTIERHRPRMGRHRRHTAGIPGATLESGGIRRQRLGQCRIGGHIKS
jgi:hypothetical protein